jgi:hypothetical protein
MGDWNYASVSDVSDLIGTEPLRVMSNAPGVSTATSTDTARVIRAGQWADGYMDARLDALGFVTPLANMSAGTALLMTDCSARLVAWKLNEMRMLTTLSGSRQAASIDTIMDEHRKAAEMTLNKIAWRQISITADRLYSRAATGKVFIPTAQTEQTFRDSFDLIK